MNSVLQQLFMIKPIRNYIVSIDLSASAPNQSSSTAGGQNGPDSKEESGVLFDDLDETDALHSFGKKSGDGDTGESTVHTKAQTEEEQRKEYNLTIFKHLQMIFGHLAESKMQYYVPKGFWRQFRFGGGEKVRFVY